MAGGGGHGLLWKARLGRHVNGARWSPDGWRIAIAYYPGEFTHIAVLGRWGETLWDHELCCANSPSFSPGGMTLAVTGEDSNRLVFYDVESGRKVLQLENASEDRIWAVDWSPSGEYIAVGGYSGRVYLYRWRGRLWRPMLLWERRPLNSMNLLAFSPRNDLIAVAGPKDVATLMISDGLMAWRRTLSVGVNGLSWSPDGERLAVATSEGLYVLRAGDGEVEASQGLFGTDALYEDVRWLGDLIVALRSDSEKGVVEIFRWLAGGLRKVYMFEDEDLRMATNLDLSLAHGWLLAYSYWDGYVAVYDISEVLETGSVQAPWAAPAAEGGAAESMAVGYSYIASRILSREARGLAGGYPGSARGTYRVRLEEGIIGRELAGSWLCSRLGCGGWGCVYRCERGGRVAAFKVPRGFEPFIEEGVAPTVMEALMERVASVAETLSRLGHPHILRLLGYSEEIPLLVYEYADQGSLEWQLSHGWKPGLDEVLLVAAQVGDALRYIHSRGLVHGDVKASNVFFVGGIAKLGDFSGLVKLLAQSSGSAFVYTPGWRAPEQFYGDLRRRSRELGFEDRMDVYQLGNLVLYMLTRETIDGEDAVDEGVVREKLGLVEDEGLRRVLSRMLAYNPWDRPSAEEAVRALAALHARRSKA